MTMKISNRQDLASHIGKQVHNLRCQKGLTQEQLAEQSELSPPYICRIETGKKLAGVNTLAKIAAVLGVTVDALIGNSPPFDLKTDFPDLHMLLNSCSTQERRILRDIAVASLTSIRENT